MSIPESVKKLFNGRKPRRGHIGPFRVGGLLDAELRSMEPGEVLEMEAGGREFGVVLMEDIEHLVERALRASK